MDVYVVDTGEYEVYVAAEDEVQACEKACEALELESVKYAEWYSDDPDDVTIE